MLNKLKSQKGITLISLIVYVVVMLVVVMTIGTITSYFYANVNKQYEESKDENNETTLDLYLTNDLKNKEIIIQTADSEEISEEGSNTIKLTYEDLSSVIYTIVIDEDNDDENTSAIYRNAVKIYSIEKNTNMVFKLHPIFPNSDSIINEKAELQLLKNGEIFKTYTINTKSRAIY